MNCKDIFLGLKYVGEDLIAEAETARFPAQANRKRARRPLLIAAVIALTLLLVGCAVVYVLRLQDMKIGEYNATIPSCEESPFEQVISSEMISLQGFAGTPGYQAAKEWQDFLSTYDTDGALRRKADAEGYREPEDYEDYICYTQQMQDKIDEICQKYGLELLGPVMIPENGVSVLDALGIDSILAQSTVAVTTLYPGYCYRGGTFALEGETVFAPGSSPWNDPIAFQYRCVMKNVFDGVFLTVGNADAYDQWNYTMSDGTPVLLAAGLEKGLIIVDKADCFVTVNVLPYAGAIPGEAQREIRAAMECFADVFRFDYTPCKVEIPEATPDPEQTQPAPSPGQEWADTPTHNAFRHALKTIHDAQIWPDLPGADGIELFDSGTIEDELFAIFDVDGDGQDELLISVSNTYTAGMREIIYGYDPHSGGVRIEADCFVAVNHYPGLLMVDSSHNQGYGGDVIWPYTIMQYDEVADEYRVAFMVDGWCREIAACDPDTGMPYPEDIDTEYDGHVYLITENGQTRIVNRADYWKWQAELFAGKEALTIPWQRMSADNIGLRSTE